MAPVELIATTAFGLESVVSRELELLGYHEQYVEDGRVVFRADELAICRCNLWLRSADRLLVKMGAFPATDFEQLFQGVTSLPWHEWLPVDAAFPVAGRSVRSNLHNPPALQAVTKKAIVESLRKNSSRYWLPDNGPLYPIEISMRNDIALLTMDTSGDGLHKRGYRKKPGPAPLRETLAAGLILLSFWNRERPFLDPFCGSGTLPIEAALISRNRAPGLGRAFVAENWSRVARDMWKQARDEARSLEYGRPPAAIYASDISHEALELTKMHARAADVLPDMQLLQRDVLEIKLPAEYGVMICNPPYGERMGDFDEAAEIYDDLADACESFTTWSIYVLTSHPDFERHFRRRADRRRKLYTGRIACQYYQYFGPRPPGDHTAPDPAFQEHADNVSDAPPNDEAPEPDIEPELTLDDHDDSPEN